MGCVFSIQHFCVDDGPGIRSCVYLKGCDLRCAWCHNPESLSPKPEISYVESRCVGCGRCAEICAGHRFENGRHSFDHHACDCGGRAAEACPSGALSIVGREMSAEEVLREVLRDRRYYQKSGGGLTVTGGEPTMQIDFLRELLAGAKAAGIHTCIETNGAAAWEKYASILPLTDLFLCDYKLTDEELHRQMTGRSNRIILENIERICAAGAQVVLRCPIIPGVNDTEDHFRAIARLTARLPLLGFELMPYHAFGVSKSQRIGGERQREFPVPEKETVECWRREILSLGGREWRREA